MTDLIYHGLLLASAGGAFLAAWALAAGEDYFAATIAGVCGLVIAYATVTG